jgi:hypothetical protein
MGTFADRANVDYRCFISSVPFIHVYIHTYHIYRYIDRYVYRYRYIYLYININTYERTNGSYPIANGLNGLNGLALYTIPLKILITVDLKSYMTCFVL